MPRISQLPSLTTADNADEIAIVDVSASTTKKITRGDLLKAPLPNNSVTTAAIANNAVTAPKIDSATFPALIKSSQNASSGSATTDMTIVSNGVVIAFGVVRKGPSEVLTARINLSGTALVSSVGTETVQDQSYSTMPAMRFIQVKPGTLTMSISGFDHMSISAMFLPILSSTLV